MPVHFFKGRRYSFLFILVRRSKFVSTLRKEWISLKWEALFASSELSINLVLARVLRGISLLSWVAKTAIVVSWVASLKSVTLTSAMELKILSLAWNDKRKIKSTEIKRNEKNNNNNNSTNHDDDDNDNDSDNDNVNNTMWQW